MRIAVLIGILALTLATAGAVAAADVPKISLNAEDMPIERAMDEVGKQAGVSILCDAGVKASITGSFQSMELEKALDLISKPNSLQWRKVYLRVQADQKPTLAQVKAQADAVAFITGGPVIVHDPATGKQKVFVEQDASAPSVDPEKLGLKPVYLVSKPKVETKAAASPEAAKRALEVQQERLKVLSSLTPEQRVTAMQQEFLLMMQLDPAVRQQMMMDQMMAMRNLDPQTRDMYRDSMRNTWRTMREQGLIPERDRGGRDGRRGRDQQSN